MELKGKGVDRMPKVKKAKAKETVKRMTKTRVTDDKYIRDKTVEKIEFCENEKKKGQTMIAQHKSAIANLELQVAKLDGAITALKEMRDMPNQPKGKK